MKGLVVEAADWIGKPRLRRVGTAVAAMLSATGVPEDLAKQILLWLGAGLAISLDLVVAFWHDQKLKKEAKSDGLLRGG